MSEERTGNSSSDAARRRSSWAKNEKEKDKKTGEGGGQGPSKPRGRPPPNSFHRASTRFRLSGALPKHDIAFARRESGRGRGRGAGGKGGGEGGRGEGGRTASSTRAARRLIAKSSGWQDRGTCHAIRE